MKFENWNFLYGLLIVEILFLIKILVKNIYLLYFFFFHKNFLELNQILGLSIALN